MEIKTTQFIGSFPSVSQCPKRELPEFAFIGRSNVGKSSLINMLCKRKELAHISKKPGKTQHINYYLINNSWFLVDLPGYGYAKVSKTKRRNWEKMIEGYLLQRHTLQCAMLLIDSNVPPQKSDLDFADWMGKMQVPFVIVFTKKDKKKKTDQDGRIEEFRQKMLEKWSELPQQFYTSSFDKSGREEILNFIDEVNGLV